MIDAKSVQLAEPGVPSECTVESKPAAAHEVRTSVRFFHLDALRAALMFWGILVHASTLGPSTIFRGIAQISGLVRMEAFFVISGFLAYMLLKKYGAKVTVKKRLLAIGLPFVTGLLLLNPVTNYLIYVYHNLPVSFADYMAGKIVEPAKGPMNWHLHLWFLVALFVYSMLSPLIERVVDRGLCRGGSRMPIRSSGLTFFAMCAAVAAGCLGFRAVFEFVLEPALPPQLDFVTRSVGNYLPFYALGMVLFAAVNLRKVFSEVHWIQTVTACALLWGTGKLPETFPNLAGEVVVLLARAYVAMCLSSLLFWLAGRWIRTENSTARLLSESAYTVYLFHFLVIYGFAFLLRGAVPNTTLLMTLVAAATFFTTLAIHRHIIRRFAFLELIFNGRPARRK